MRLTIGEAADVDLDGITEYTIQTWGVDQADTYLGGLLDYLDTLAENPALGKCFVRSPKGYRRAKFRWHFVYFTVVDDNVWIVRILHERMNQSAHLP